MILLPIFYGLCLAVLAYKRYNLALAWLIFTLPVYLIRFKFGPLPTTLLELNFAILLLVWLINYAKKDWPEIKKFIFLNKLFFLFWGLFLAGSVAGILISDQWYISLGQWRAYFLEPLIFFIILLGRAKDLNPEFLALAGVAGTIPVSLVAILQKFSVVFYPPSLWDDLTFGRSTSFFTTPNAIGLFIVPLLFLGLTLLHAKTKRTKTQNQSIIVLMVAAVLGLLALGFSQSVGAAFGVAAGVVTLLGLLYSPRLALAALVIGLLVVILPPSRELLTKKAASLQNRLTLWGYSKEFLSKNPKNFFWGAGIRQFFRKVQKPHYNVKELERLIYPHNIFLNFWTEIGLVGLAGFIGIYGCLVGASYQIYQHKNRLVGAVLISALVALLAHGLVDVPYFKNDLSFLFWLLAAAVFLNLERTEF